MADWLFAGLGGSNFDDILRPGPPAFRELLRKTHERFEMGEDQSIPCTFSGFHLEDGKEGCITQHQNMFLRRLEHLPLYAMFMDFPSNRMHLACLAKTRPDCLFEISQLAQITEQLFNKEKKLPFGILTRR